MKFEDRKLDLYESYYANNDITQLLNCAIRLLGNPIIVTSSSYRVIYLINPTDRSINDPIWKFAEQFGYCSADSIHEFKKAGVTVAVHESERPIMIDYSVGEKLPRVVNKIISDYKIIGYLGLFQLNRQITSEDMELIKTLCMILATALKLDKNKIAEFHDSIHDDIIIELLANKIYRHDVLNDRMKSAKWHSLDLFNLIIIPLSPNDASLYYHSYFKNEILGKIPIAKITLFNDNLIILLNSNKKDHLNHAKKMLADIIIQHDLKAYCSNYFDNLLDLSNQFYLLKEIVQAVSIMTEQKNGIFDANDYLQISVLLTAGKYMDLSKYESKEYTALHIYDQTYGTDHIKTLLIYIECASNIKKSAEILDIHRNTMSMRLTQIEKIVGDINDGVNLQRIYISDLIHHVKNHILIDNVSSAF
ncbi:MAG: PucR family transcriptional regulator [Eubacteriaceae bacterium]